MISQAVSLFLIQYAFMIINNDGMVNSKYIENGSVTFYINSTHRILNFMFDIFKNLWNRNLENPPMQCMYSNFNWYVDMCVNCALIFLKLNYKKLV